MADEKQVGQQRTTLTDALLRLDAVISARVPSSSGDVVVLVPEAVLRAFAAEAVLSAAGGLDSLTQQARTDVEFTFYAPGRRFVIRAVAKEAGMREHRLDLDPRREMARGAFLDDLMAVCTEAAAKSGLSMREALRAMLKPPLAQAVERVVARAEEERVNYRIKDMPCMESFANGKAEGAREVLADVRGEGPHGGRSEQVGERQWKCKRCGRRLDAGWDLCYTGCSPIQQQRVPTREETLDEVVDYLRNGLPQGVGGMVTVQQVIGGVERLKACEPGRWADLCVPVDGSLQRKHAPGCRLMDPHFAPVNCAATPRAWRETKEIRDPGYHLPGCGLDKYHGGRCGPDPRSDARGATPKSPPQPFEAAHREGRQPTQSEMLDAEWNAALDTVMRRIDQDKSLDANASMVVRCVTIALARSR